MTDFGHCVEYTPPRVHTALSLPGFSILIQAQFLAFTKPLDRHVSHLHAAGEEN